MSDSRDRQQMAINLLRQGKVMRVKEDYFRVTGNSGKDWNIAVWDDNNIRCSCPVNKIKKQECHHVKAVQMYLTSVRTVWRMW